MALYLNKKDIIHRVCNGYLSDTGYVNGRFFDIWKANGFDADSMSFCRMMDCFMVILDSMDDKGIQIYPKDLRGRKLREVRKSKNRSANWLAMKTGLSKTTIYDIENGVKIPRIGTLEKIANALKVEIETLG